MGDTSEQMQTRTLCLCSEQTRTQGFRYGGEIHVRSVTLSCKCVSVFIAGERFDLHSGDSVMVPPANTSFALQFARKLTAFEAQVVTAQVECLFYGAPTCSRCSDDW
jgi:hypothetical protein